jgi:mono/diheme cytochrome c family protein
MRLAISVLLLILSSAPQQKTTLDGVYTAAQVTRGEAVVLKVGCQKCHGDDLSGGPDEITPLWGEDFIQNWSGGTLKDLRVKLTEMPAGAPAKLSPQEYADLLAVLLQINGYPEGKSEVPTEPEALAQIKFVPLP